MKGQIVETDTAAPIARNRLKGKVYEAGYPTIKELAGELCIHPTYFSRILGGWDFPTPGLQRKLAEKLGLTVRELRELL